MSGTEGTPIVADERTGIVRNATREEAADLSEDGVISEPGKLIANVLWIVKQIVLGAGIVWILAILGMLAFTPDSPKGVVDAATLVAVLGLLISSFMQGFQRRQS